MVILFLPPRPWRFLNISISFQLCSIKVERGVSSNVGILLFVFVLLLAFLLLPVLILVLFPAIIRVAGGVEVCVQSRLAGFVEVGVDGIEFEKDEEDEEERKMLLECRCVMNLDIEAGVVMAVRGLVGKFAVETFVDTFADVSMEERVLILSIPGEAQILRDDSPFLFI